MSKKLFSEAEIEQLRSNPNVAKVTRRVIDYNDDFKAKALNEYNSGKSARKIFSENGLSIEILGIGRIRGFFQRMSRETTKSPTVDSSTKDAKSIKRLERQIAYLQQENEFLKKIQELQGRI